jgi:hypothetical protein
LFFAFELAMTQKKTQKVATEARGTSAEFYSMIYTLYSAYKILVGNQKERDH